MTLPSGRLFGAARARHHGATLEPGPVAGDAAQRRATCQLRHDSPPRGPRRGPLAAWRKRSSSLAVPCACGPRGSKVTGISGRPITRSRDTPTAGSLSESGSPAEGEWRRVGVQGAVRVPVEELQHGARGSEQGAGPGRWEIPSSFRSPAITVRSCSRGSSSTSARCRLC